MYKYKIIDSDSSLREEHRFIDITVEVENLFVQDVAAATIRELSFAKIDPNKKVFYEDFLTTIESLIHSKFEILSSKQSSRSYSRYIDFEANNIWWTVRIKISNHDKNENEDVYQSASKNNNRRSAFRSILIGEDKEFKSPFAALTALDEILEGIYNDDLDIIYTDYSDHNFTDNEIQNTLDKLHVDRNFKLIDQ